MAFDDIVLEPLQKDTINYLIQLKLVLVILHQILEHFYLFQIIYYKVTFDQLGHSVGSFVINTSVGILGFFNPAEKMG
jgi:ABC-type transporter lipoprotein component MlaA